MTPPLDELYFTWLYGQVGSVKIANPSRTYWALCRQLFKKEFVWIVPNDDNRAEDGRDLRQEFLEEERIAEVEDDWLRYGCSMLELLIALSRRCAFEAGDTSEHWFWRIMGNAQLAIYNDRVLNFAKEVDEKLDCIIWRTYMPSGRGGLFPLENPDKDQRRVEIWYQLCAYLLENGY